VRRALKTILTIVIDPGVFNFLDINPAIWSFLASHYHGGVSVSMVLEFGFEVKGNHSGLAIVTKSAFNAQVKNEPAKSFPRVRVACKC
jgi:hypothetical protein